LSPNVGMVGPTGAGTTEPPPPSPDPWPVGGDPTKPTNSGQSIATRIANATAGTTLTLPDNTVFREAVTVNKSLTIQGGAGTEIRAADHWAGGTWTDLGNGTWRSTNTVPNLTVETRWQFEPITALTANAAAGATTLNVASTGSLTVGETYTIGRGRDACSPQALYDVRQITAKTATTVTLNTGLSNSYSSTGTCAASVCFGEGAQPEQVFLNGQKVLTRTAGAVPVGDQFSLDASRRVIIAHNPNTNFVEVTTRNSCMTVSANDVTIQDISFRYAGNTTFTKSASATNFIMRRCECAYAHTRGINAGQTQVTIQDSYFHHCGQLAAIHTGGTFMFDGNKYDWGNYKKFRYGWEGGGIKVSDATNGTFTGCEVVNSFGNGFWTDITRDPQTWDVSYNRCHHNVQQGIRIEVTKNTDIYGNVCWENGTNIQVSGCFSVNVFNNLSAWSNGRGIQIDQQTRSDTVAADVAYDRTHDIQVYNNDIIQSSNAFAIAWFQNLDAGQTSIYADVNNDGYNNRFAYASANGTLISENTVQRYKWTSAYTTLAAMQAAGQEAGSTNLNQAGMQAALTAGNVPLTPEL
jgi:hypothetical protein